MSVMMTAGAAKGLPASDRLIVPTDPFLTCICLLTVLRYRWKQFKSVCSGSDVRDTTGSMKHPRQYKLWQ